MGIPPVGGHPLGWNIWRGAQKNGPVTSGFVGPQSTPTGVPNAFAKCMPPVSFPTRYSQVASSWAREGKSVLPARSCTRSAGNAFAI